MSTKLRSDACRRNRKTTQLMSMPQCSVSLNACKPTPHVHCWGSWREAKPPDSRNTTKEEESRGSPPGCESSTRTVRYVQQPASQQSFGLPRGLEHQAGSGKPLVPLMWSRKKRKGLSASAEWELTRTARYLALLSVAIKISER